MSDYKLLEAVCDMMSHQSAISSVMLFCAGCFLILFIFHYLSVTVSCYAYLLAHIKKSLVILYLFVVRSACIHNSQTSWPVSNVSLFGRLSSPVMPMAREVAFSIDVH